MEKTKTKMLVGLNIAARSPVSKDKKLREVNSEK